MSTFLLAAEADKIQDFVFRSSHLREVVGGSQLLSRFCGEGSAALQRQFAARTASLKVRPLVSDGGAFRVLFTHPDEGEAERQARAFGEGLAEVYRWAIGGSLTVAPPVRVPDEGPPDVAFQAASRQAHQALRTAKERGAWPTSVVQLPYAASCASCGVMIAASWEQRHADESPGYLCASCRSKARERDYAVKLVRERQGFLGAFLEAAEAAGGGRLSMSAERFPQDAEEVGQFDRRNYVAYLLADGNGMGTHFGRCGADQMESLSKQLPASIGASLAAPCPQLCAQIHAEFGAGRAWPEQEKILPVLPLILGGDDLFALLPAPWALDFAGRFCGEYERRMHDLLQNLGLPPACSVSAAVVICKANYPYSLAHQRGEELLQEAKRFARRCQRSQPDASPSVVTFEVVTGHARSSGGGVQASLFRASMKPYFAGRGSHDPAGVALRELVRCRQDLESLPNKRLAELETRYDMHELPPNEDELPTWARDLKSLLNRIGRVAAHRDAVANALATLGGSEESTGYWRFVQRTGEPDGYRQGLPDLLEAWGYARSLAGTE